MLEKRTETSIGGTLPQKIHSCMDYLDILLKSSDAIVASMVVAEKSMNQNMSMGNHTLNSIMNVMSIKDLKTISLDSKLSDLGKTRTVEFSKSKFLTLTRDGLTDGCRN